MLFIGPRSLCGIVWWRYLCFSMYSYVSILNLISSIDLIISTYLNTHWQHMLLHTQPNLASSNFPLWIPIHIWWWNDAIKQFTTRENVIIWMFVWCVSCIYYTIHSMHCCVSIFVQFIDWPLHVIIAYFLCEFIEELQGKEIASLCSVNIN